MLGWCMSPHSSFCAARACNPVTYAAYHHAMFLEASRHFTTTAQTNIAVDEKDSKTFHTIRMDFRRIGCNDEIAC